MVQNFNPGLELINFHELGPGVCLGEGGGGEGGRRGYLNENDGCLKPFVKR